MGGGSQCHTPEEQAARNRVVRRRTGGTQQGGPSEEQAARNRAVLPKNRQHATGRVYVFGPCVAARSAPATNQACLQLAGTGCPHSSAAAVFTPSAAYFCHGGGRGVPASRVGVHASRPGRQSLAACHPVCGPLSWVLVFPILQCYTHGSSIMHNTQDGTVSSAHCLQ